MSDSIITELSNLHKMEEKLNKLIAEFIISCMEECVTRNFAAAFEKYAHLRAELQKNVKENDVQLSKTPSSEIASNSLAVQTDQVTEGVSNDKGNVSAGPKESDDRKQLKNVIEKSCNNCKDQNNTSKQKTVIDDSTTSSIFADCSNQTLNNIAGSSEYANFLQKMRSGLNLSLINWMLSSMITCPFMDFGIAFNFYVRFWLNIEKLDPKLLAQTSDSTSDQEQQMFDNTSTTSMTANERNATSITMHTDAGLKFCKQFSNFAQGVVNSKQFNANITQHIATIFDGFPELEGLFSSPSKQQIPTCMSLKRKRENSIKPQQNALMVYENPSKSQEQAKKPHFESQDSHINQNETTLIQDETQRPCTSQSLICNRKSYSPLPATLNNGLVTTEHASPNISTSPVPLSTTSAKTSLSVLDKPDMEELSVSIQNGQYFITHNNCEIKFEPIPDSPKIRLVAYITDRCPIVVAHIILDTRVTVTRFFSRGVKLSHFSAQFTSPVPDSFCLHFQTPGKAEEMFQMIMEYISQSNN